MFTILYTLPFPSSNFDNFVSSNLLCYSPVSLFSSRSSHALPTVETFDRDRVATVPFLILHEQDPTPLVHFQMPQLEAIPSS